MREGYLRDVSLPGQRFCEGRGILEDQNYYVCTCIDVDLVQLKRLPPMVTTNDNEIRKSQQLALR